MTLIRGANQRGGRSSLAPNTTIYGEESLIENGEIEELHYLSVKVERMKKAMLNRVEGLNHTEAKDPKPSSYLLIDENDRREEMLYRSMDHLIETQTGGGDILIATGTGDSKASYNMSSNAMRRNSELSDMGISDHKD